MLTFDLFQRSFMLRPTTEIGAAKIHNMSSVNLPKMSIIHHINDSSKQIGIRGSNLLLRGWTEDVRVSFVQDGYGQEGTFKTKSFNASKAIKQYRMQQKRFRVQPDYKKAVMARQALVVMDYSILPLKVDYTANMRRFFWEWQNINTSVLSKIEEIGITRKHFVEIHLPDSWPSRANLKKVEDELNGQELARWTDDGHFWLREVYRFIKGKSELLDIGIDYSKEALNNPKLVQNDVNFIFRKEDKCIIMSANDLRRRAIDAEGETLLKWHKKLSQLVQLQTDTDQEVSDESLEEDDDSVDAFANFVEQEEIEEEAQLIEGVPNSASMRIAELGQAGRLTANEQNRLINIAQRTEQLDNPFGEGTLKEATTITPERLAVTEELPSTANKKTIPEHALKSTTTNLRRDYINNGLLEADILNMLQMSANAGVFIQDIKKEKIVDAINNIDVLKVKVTPIQGLTSTLPIELPVIDAEGNFMADGVKYTMDAQKVDMPIRKVSSQRAALTSYMGKLFTQRSPLASSNYSSWVRKVISKAALDAEDERVTNQRFGGNRLPKGEFPLEYTALMEGLTQFDSNGITFYLDHSKRGEFFGKEGVAEAEKGGNVAVGLNENDEVVTMDLQGNLEVKGEVLGHFLDVLGGNWGKQPTGYSETLIFGKRIPTALILGYSIGLRKLVNKTKARYRTVPANTRLPKDSIGQNEIVIRFNDVYMIVDGTDPVISLIFQGFAEMNDITRDFNMNEFNKRDVFSPLLKAKGAAKHHFVELDMIREMFVDPITKEILEDMKEPTDIIDLLIKCVWLIRNDDYTDETDPKFQRRRGYERIAGFVYTALIKSIREQRNRPNPANHALTMGPRDVWMEVTSDPTVQLVKELNPVHTLKEQEAVSLSGAGGRASQTLVKSSRTFHENDVGSISESTPDSGKVGIRTYLTGNAKTKNLRGVYEDFDFERDGSTSVLSTTALLLPAMHHDDKRLSSLNLSNCGDSL